MKTLLKYVVGTVLAIATSQLQPRILAQEPLSSLAERGDAFVESSIVVESFDIAGMLERLKAETGMSNDQSRDWLEQRIWSLLGGKRVGDPTAPAASVLGVQTSDGQSVEMQLDMQGQGVLLVGKDLIVTASPTQMERITQNIETLKQFGFRQIVITTHVFRDSTEAMKKLPINWSLVEAATKVAQVRKPEVQPASFTRSSSLTAAGRFLERQQPVASHEMAVPAGVTTATWTEATSVIERATPVLYTLLTTAEYQGLLNATQRSSTLERVMSPTVVVFNGQVATISDSIERPFVTGVKPVLIGTSEKQQVEFTPSIRVYPEGTTMKIRPELQDGVQVRLHYELNLCKVRSVQAFDLPSVDGRGKFKVQMPEVASTQFRTCLDLPIDHTLAVSAFETDPQGKQRSILVLCRCTLSDVEKNGK